MSRIILLASLVLSFSTFAQDRPEPPTGGMGGKPPSFSDFDQNGDGYISLDETRGPMQNDFNDIDTNSDGLLTESEIDLFMKNHRPPESPRD
ncbi:EF-hand domain-containing protein [Marinomonas mediterranea]|nr:EF-hand domain-containing protein [Marinomonas mediterranea]WCN09930.1 EF-hand domain-containing protein [Marinomonas mediterranea]WCN14012.1 EF-hand domain-containing protein [Marinomonas mediterranea]WCN18063.1 EF-hand domain-containing protein [Marinomonas mediterranea MMB-1]